MAPHFHQLQVINIRRETAGCISFAFDIPVHLKAVFAFMQGQNITIKAFVNGEELRRSYSICSSPLDHELRVAVKKVPDGKFSSWANQFLTNGSLLSVMPPTGKFYTTLDAANKKKYMAFAAGSGITPLLSIIKTTLAAEPDSHFTLVYGNKNRATIIFKEALEGLKNKYTARFSVHYILSREKTETPLQQGRIDAAKCQLIFQHITDVKKIDEFFLCGPGEMIFTVRNFLQEKGIDKQQIHAELFTAPGSGNASTLNFDSAVGPQEPGKTSKVTIQLDGISFDFELPYNGTTVLNAALALGADLPFACKGGVCATCRAKLLSGAVTMDSNYALEPEEVANGYILTCQSHPQTEKVVIDFDQK